MATLRRSPIFRMLLGVALGSIVLMTLIPGVALGLPLVAITRPTLGTTVSGVIWIDVAFRSDSNKPITRLEVYIDDALAREMDLTTPMLEGRQSFNWDFSYASATTHKISARAIDSANAAAAASISVQVQNAAVVGPDRIPPVVRIYYPAQGAKLHGQVEVKAEATDNVGVELVYFYIDGRLHKMMMNAPPYVDSWDTTRESDGNHVVEAVAVDAQENEARSAQVTVIVENHSLTTMNAAGGLHTAGVNPGAAGVFSPSGASAPPLQPQLNASVPPAPAINPPAPAPNPTVTLQPWDPMSSNVVVPATAKTPAGAAQHGPVVAGASALSLPNVAPLLPLAGPKVATIVPRTDSRAQIPVAPSSDTLLTLDAPLAVSASRPNQLFAAPTPSLAPRTSTAGLAKPGAALSSPLASAAAHPAPKAVAPTLTQERSPLGSGAQMAAGPGLPAWEAVAVPQTAPRTAAPRQLGTAPAAGLTATLAPTGLTAPQITPAGRASIAVAKSAAPAARMSPAASSSPSRVAQRSQADIQVVTPIGSPVAMSTPQAVVLKPVTSVIPDHKAMSAGLVRTTAPATATVKSAPASKPTVQIAAVTRPPIAVAPLTQAALAEYRGSPVPASRMLAMLPSPSGGKLAAEGRVTAPDTVCAALPVAKVAVRDIKIVFDGEVLSLRTAPETRKGISLAPLREIFEKTDGVLYWLPVEKKVEAVNKNVNVKLTIGDPKISVNGEAQTLQIAPFIKQGRTMVPLQFIADVLDVKIVFDNGTGQILISSNQF